MTGGTHQNETGIGLPHRPGSLTRIYSRRAPAHARIRRRDRGTAPARPPARAGCFTDFRSIMLSPLPRVYEEGHNGQAVPSEPEPTMIGGDVQVERLTSAAAEAKKRLDVEVLQPVKQWMVAYRTILVRRPLGRARGRHRRAWLTRARTHARVGSDAGSDLRTHPSTAPAPQQERMRRLEALRLELDSRRRTVLELQGARC